MWAGVSARAGGPTADSMGCSFAGGDRSPEDGVLVWTTTCCALDGETGGLISDETIERMLRSSMMR